MTVLPVNLGVMDSSFLSTYSVMKIECTKLYEVFLFFSHSGFGLREA